MRTRHWILGALGALGVLGVASILGHAFLSQETEAYATTLPGTYNLYVPYNFPSDSNEAISVPNFNYMSLDVTDVNDGGHTLSTGRTITLTGAPNAARIFVVNETLQTITISSGSVPIATLFGAVIENNVTDGGADNWVLVSTTALPTSVSAGTTGQCAVWDGGVLTAQTCPGAGVSSWLGVDNVLGEGGVLPWPAGDGGVLIAPGAGGVPNWAQGLPGQVLTLDGGVPTWQTPSGGVNGAGLDGGSGFLWADGGGGLTWVAPPINAATTFTSGTTYTAPCTGNALAIGFGGGGGGGSGDSSAGAGAGGGGGGASLQSEQMFAMTKGTSYYVVIGAAANGGAAATGASGNAGTAGNASCVNTYSSTLCAFNYDAYFAGGGAGYGGSSTNMGPGGGPTAATACWPSSLATAATQTCGPGYGGASYPGAGTAFNGGTSLSGWAGGAYGTTATSYGGGGGAGGPVSKGTTVVSVTGTGGAGGNGSTTSPTGGGNGAANSGAGGGGGGATLAAVASGAGGNGGSGLITIIPLCGP